MFQQMEADTGITPPSLASKPKLHSRWTIPYRIWDRLGRSRNFTMSGPAPIPVSEFVAHCQVYGLDVHDSDLWEDIQEIDACYLQQVTEKLKTERERSKSKSSDTKQKAR